MKKYFKFILLILIILEIFVRLSPIYGETIISKTLIVPAGGFDDIMFTTSESNISIDLFVSSGNNISLLLMDNTDYQLYRNGFSSFALINLQEISSINQTYSLNGTNLMHLILDNTYSTNINKVVILTVNALTIYAVTTNVVSTGISTTTSELTTTDLIIYGIASIIVIGSVIYYYRRRKAKKEKENVELSEKNNEKT